MTSEQEGLFLRRFTKAIPIVPEEPITRARKGFGSNFIEKLLIV
jgi:hypothetical protein